MSGRQPGRCVGWVLLGLAFSGLAAAPLASAEMFRCVGPDGKTFYTGDASRCSGAQKHELKGRIHAVDGGSRTSRTRVAPPAAAYDSSDTMEKMWREKRAKAEDERRQIRDYRRRFEGMTRACNRGGTFLREDEAGLRERVSCGEIEAQRVKLAERERELDSYLASGLAEECRRAGCLPGWIR